MAWYLSPPTILNANFEAGSLDNWTNDTENNSFFTIETTVIHSGSYAAKLQGVNSRANIGITNIFTINPNHTYQCNAFTLTDSLFAAGLLIRARQYNNQNDDISSRFSVDIAITDNTLHNWTLQSFTLGPSGDNADITLADCANGLAIDFAFASANSGNLAHIDQVNLFQTLNVIPMWGYTPNVNKIESEMRTKTGKRYVRKVDDYKDFNIPVEFFPSSKATLVNSWFKDNTNLMWIATSGDNTEVNCVRITNNSKPFDMLMPYNIDQYGGTIILEER
jgi:hypothetical protein